MTFFNSLTWNKNRFLDLLFYTYIAVIIFLLVMPTTDDVKLNLYFLGIRTDHFIHASIFIPFLIYFRLKVKTKINSRIFFQLYLLGIVFAVCCECLQIFVPYRTFDPADIVANIVGISIGGISLLWKTN